MDSPPTKVFKSKVWNDEDFLEVENPEVGKYYYDKKNNSVVSGKLENKSGRNDLNVMTEKYGLCPNSNYCVKFYETKPTILYILNPENKNGGKKRSRKARRKNKRTVKKNKKTKSRR